MRMTVSRRRIPLAPWCSFLAIRTPAAYYPQPIPRSVIVQLFSWTISWTGDIVKRCEDGFYYVVDRKKELIKVKGNQVAPAELEGHLLLHPAVADVAVIPMPDERAGERPRACVVLKPDAEATEDELKEHVAKALSAYKHLGAVTFVDEVPKSASGKILRKNLRAMFA
eukprot:TRINITY_DN7388_c0_g1_i6.p3 TRINITY_DN7388_c0_g1~~TRINITY_DN7388_c0_g1_i6.p3  ORF type:complete len:168 (+),score=36.67 TRINITY_DN7388_c0_g1_i6:535-1038(+)